MFQICLQCFKYTVKMVTFVIETLWNLTMFTMQCFKYIVKNRNTVNIVYCVKLYTNKLALSIFRPPSISLCCLDWPVSEIVALKKEGAFCGFLSLCSFPERWIREWWPLSGPGFFHPGLKSPNALKGVQDCTISTPPPPLSQRGYSCLESPGLGFKHYRLN